MEVSWTIHFQLVIKNIFKIKDVDPNGKLTGAITFEAKKGDSNLELIYRPDVMSKEEVKVELK